MRKSKIKSTGDLRSMLLDTIEQVRNGEMEPRQARTIATLATTVLHSAKLDLEMLRFHAENERLGQPATKPLALVG